MRVMLKLQKKYNLKNTVIQWKFLYNIIVLKLQNKKKKQIFKIITNIKNNNIKLKILFKNKKKQ